MGIGNTVLVRSLRGCGEQEKEERERERERARERERERETKRERERVFRRGVQTTTIATEEVMRSEDCFEAMKMLIEMIGTSNMLHAAA